MSKDDQVKGIFGLITLGSTSSPTTGLTVAPTVTTGGPFTTTTGAQLHGAYKKQKDNPRWKK